MNKYYEDLIEKQNWKDRGFEQGFTEGWKAAINKIKDYLNQQEKQTND